jgi:hypothetical protein
MAKRIRVQAVVVCATGSAALLVASTTAAAAPKPISGKLSRAGYEVIALAPDGGEGTSDLAEPDFRLRPPAKRVSLHLRAADGTYAGPVVLAKERKGKRAAVGVVAGTALGKIAVKAAKGYAKVADKPPERSLDPDQQARARNGVPIGAGSFGRVHSRKANGSAGDRDVDGIPASLDIDDDGDLVLDNIDASAAQGITRSTQAGGCGPSGIYCPVISSVLVANNLVETVNVNAGSTAAQIDTAVSSFGHLRIINLPGSNQPGDVSELDCAGDAGDPRASPPRPPRPGLRYCSSGGTGTVFNVGEPRPAFPGDPGGPFDPDGDGFGTLTPNFFLLHGAVTRDPSRDPSVSQIGAGDPLVQHVTTGGGDPRDCPRPPTAPPIPTCSSFYPTVNYIFATVPALVSYDDGAGNARTVSYPVPPPSPGFIPPGTGGNAFPVRDSDDADSDIEVRLTFWRPQRRPIPEERCPEPDGPLCTADQWIDIGGLTNGANMGGPGCPQSAFTNPDPLWTQSPHPLAPGLTDPAPDRPASPDNKFSYELNLTQCAANGVTFQQGDEKVVAFTARPGAPDFTQLNVAFRHE